MIQCPCLLREKNVALQDLVARNWSGLRYPKSNQSYLIASFWKCNLHESFLLLGFDFEWLHLWKLHKPNIWILQHNLHTMVRCFPSKKWKFHRICSTSPSMTFQKHSWVLLISVYFSHILKSTSDATFCLSAILPAISPLHLLYIAIATLKRANTITVKPTTAIPT